MGQPRLRPRRLRHRRRGLREKGDPQPKVTYLPFVRALISRLASVNPRCEFISGTSHLSWWAHFVFLTVAFGFLAFVLVLLYTAVGSLVFVKLFIIAFFIPATIRWFTKNWPRKFPPHAIPENHLPEPQGKKT